MICPWTFLSSPEPAAPAKLGKSFAQAVVASDDDPVLQLPPRNIIGDTVRIKITQKVYEAGINNCSFNLQGRVTLQKKDPPITTLFEIASGIGTPLVLDDATKSRSFGIYARILIDVDMSGKLFNSVIVEREGFAFPVEVQYERQPSFCSHCRFLGHTIQQCKKLGAQSASNRSAVDKRKTFSSKGLNCSNLQGYYLLRSNPFSLLKLYLYTLLGPLCIMLMMK